MKLSRTCNRFCVRWSEKCSFERKNRSRNLFFASGLLFVLAGCTQTSDVTLSSPWAVKDLQVELKIQNPFKERARLVGFEAGCSCLNVEAPEYSFIASESKSCHLIVDAKGVPLQTPNGGEVKVVPLFETQEHPYTKLSGQAFIIKYGPMRLPIEIQPRVVDITEQSTSARFTVQVLCPNSVLSINSPESVRVSCLPKDELDGTKTYDCEVTSKGNEYLAHSGDFTLEAKVTTHEQNSASAQIEFEVLKPVSPILTGEIDVSTEHAGKTFLILKVSENALPKCVSVAKIHGIIGKEGIAAMCLPEKEADQLIFRFPLEDGQVPEENALFVDAVFSTGGLSEDSVVLAERKCLFCKSSKGESK